jgi:site-specific DNA-methyltransferase (adenine-specific)
MIELENATVYLGSNLDVLPMLPDNSIDSIVTDPPYELGFMGKSWDNSGIAYSVELWTECMRVLKPGGHLLAFGGSRTWHRLAVAIEDAGFEMRDSIAWLYGSGFPKSHNVALGIDKVMGHANRGRAIPTASKYQASDIEEKNKLTSNPVEAYESKSPESEPWQGWGTALKPAFEPIVVARKPLIGTVAANVLEWGTGGLNIDASRIAGEQVTINTFDNGAKPFGDAVGEPFTSRQSTGRWPANIILDPYTAELLDEQSGVSKSPPSHIAKSGKTNKIYSSGIGLEIGDWHKGFGDSGGSSRFFYVAKANKRDRNEGLEELEKRVGAKQFNEGMEGNLRSNGTEIKPAIAQNNFHPTVKPTALMEYLIKLVTPEGGTVLDPFTGSGSTGKAALLNGFNFIGIELTEEYLPIIEGRLKWAINQTKIDKGESLF